MESGNGGASSKGVLVPVSASSDAFQSSVLAPLKSAYLYEESKQSFRYKSAVLIKNPALEEKYNAFRAKRREIGYSEEDLKESYGFLLFDDVNKANSLGETGVLTGNGTCTTLGDPSKGVYISMYSDCLDLNRWYHGKSGYIAIIRLTKGRVKRVLENYTQNYTAPTEGFDCHVSDQLPSVSAKTSSFLAFERTQYYMYELVDDGSNETAQSPSAACPFAIVSFSYTDTKATPEEKSEEKKQVCPYFPWKGQLQIGTNIYDVGLRSTAGVLIPAQLPPVVKVDRVISMLDLRQLLPKAVFETCLTGEAFLDGLYCSLCELVSSETEDTSSLSLLLWEIKEKDVALTIPLSDSGFLILLHSSHFLTYDDSGSSASEALKGVFVFPDSRVVQRETKFGQRKPAISSEILRVLPVLSYAEGEVEKTSFDPSEELCEVFSQHMQRYAALINPGLAQSPSRDVSIFPDHYDVPDDHKHLYSSPEWTDKAWQNFRSYLSKPASFQLPVSRATEILAAGQEDRIDDLHDDVYFCLSSPEEAPINHDTMESEDQLTDEKSAVNVERSMDSCLTSAEAQVDAKAVPQNVVPDGLQPGDATEDPEKSDPTVLIKTYDVGTKNPLTLSTSDDLPAELIVSISSAERTVTDACLSVVSSESATKHNDFELSGFSTAKLHMAGVKSLNDETVETKTVFEGPELTSLTKTKCRKLQRGLSKVRKHASKACIEPPRVQSVKLPEEDDSLKSQKENQAMESSGHPQLNNPSNTDWRKVRRRKRIFGKISSRAKKVRSATVGLALAERKKTEGANPGLQGSESTILMELETIPLRRKTERWDLKPVTSKCGRILVPHGSVDFADQIKSLKDKLQSTKDEQCPEKMLVDASYNANDTVKMEQESTTAPEKAVDEKEATTSKVDGGNHLLNAGQINPEPSILRQSDDGNGSLTLNPESNNHSSKTDGTDTPPSKAVQEKPDTPSPGRCSTKGEILLSKLKSVILGGKRKTGILVSTQTTADAAQDAEPCLKKSKADSHSGMLKSSDAIASVQNTSLSVKEVSKMMSVDPIFAYALGLTPKETPDEIQKSEGQDTQQTKDPSEAQEQTKIIQRPLSIFPKRTRIKTLKKHQGISAENVKKKWWLHFQTPACFASENLKYNDCTRDNSVRKTVKEKSSSACSSTDALTLLADLALSASKDQVPPQPDPALTREPETSLKKCDVTKDLTTAEQESVLHALLRQPAARPIQPVESPAPSHLVGGSELVDLVSKEHAYSLPPSSSLLLGLSGTPFQVSPLSGSTRLLHHHQTMYGDGLKTLHPSVDQEDRGEHNYRTPEYLKKHMMRRRKFRQSRTFVNKDGSIQVTKQWKENYDFNLDSKFTSDSKDRGIIRALHGPWDFSIQDTNEEVRLIVHMWIGLFYSRTTARFFHVDSNPCSEEGDSLEMSSGMVSAVAQSDFKAFATSPNVTDTSDSLTSKALDLSKKDTPVLDQGSVILDLSLKNSSAEIVTSDPQVNKKETSVPGEQKEASETLNTVKSPVGLHKGGPFQCYRKNVHLINAVNDVRRTFETKRTYTPVQKAVCLKQIDVPSFKGGGTFISVKEEKENVSVQPAIGAKIYMKDSIENSEAARMGLVQKQGKDSSKSVMDKEEDSNKKAGDVVHKTEYDESESKDGEKKENPCKESNVEVAPKLIHTGDLTNKGPGIVCNGHLLENKLPQEEPKAASLGKAENVNEDVDCCAGHEDKVTKADQFEKEDGLNEKDHCILTMEADSDLNDQPLPMMCDGPNAVKKDCITERNCQAPLDEQPPQTENKEDAGNDLKSRNLCANGNAWTDKHAFSEKAPCPLSDMALFDNEPAVVGNTENEAHLADSSDQPLPMICDGPDSVKKNGITDCDHQAQLDEEPPQAGNKEDAGHDLQSRELRAKCSALTDENAIAEKAPHAPSEMGPIHNKSAVVENSENDVCVTDLGDQPLPMICDGPDSVKRGCITECHRQVPLNEEPPQAGNNEDASHDLQSGEVCANGSALTGEHAISEKALHTPPEMKPTKPTMEENSENGVCLADLSDQPLPMICDSPDLVKKECITECNRQAPLDEEPPQADKEDANTSALTEEHTVSEKAPHAPSELTHIHNEPADEENSENAACLADKAHYQKALPMSDENNCSSEGSSGDLSIPQTNDSVEPGSPNKVRANFNLRRDDHEYCDTKSVEEEQNVDNTTQKELFYHQSYSPQCEAVTRCESEVALTNETDKNDSANKGLEKIHGRVVIPFIGIDISGEDAVQPHDLHSEGKVEEFQGQKGIPFISETTCPETVLPTEVCSTSQMHSKKTELSAGKISLLHVSETNLPDYSGSESDDRSPTPTMDEEPYEYVTCSDPSSSGRSSSSALSGSEACKNRAQKCPSRSSTFINNELPLDRKHKSTVKSDPSPQRELHPDLELRTLRVLQSIDKFLSKSSHTDKSSQIKSGHMKHSLDQTPNTSIKCTPTCVTPHTSADFKDKKTSNTKSAMLSASTLREAHTESSDHFLISPFKSKLEQVLGVRLQLKKTESSVHQHYFEKTDKPQVNSVGQDYCHPLRSYPSAECSQASKLNIDQDGHKTPSQTNLSHEPRSYSQRPVMAVKPSKSDEIQAERISKDRQIESSVMSNYSQNKKTEIPFFTYATLASMILEKKAESLRGSSAGRNNYTQEASELSSKNSCSSNVSDSKSNSDKARFALLDPLHQYEGRDISKFNRIPSSSLPMQSFEYAKISSPLVDGNQSSLTNTLVGKAGLTANKNTEMDQKDCSGTSTLVVDYREDSIADDNLFLGPQSTLTCTVYNTSQKRPDSFLDQVSQRCLQDDPTQASMEQECLIFSEQMKQLLKRSKREPSHQLDMHDGLNLCGSSPVTVHFSSLEEDEDSVDHFDAPSLVGQKIKVDMSDRKDLAEVKEEGKTLHSQRVSQGTGNPMEHAGVSRVTAECARLYRAMMNDICSVRKVSSRSDHLRMDRVYPKTEPSNHFDFCDQMKKEVDESFRSNLNSVVKKSCKTKYRFYILVTSDDAFFEETKAQLEAEGHTAVQPSEFFLGEDSSSSLLIILRNEDIAEHICEVPHLLELKKSPGVQFAGIDEPDDVVNLTHQELFMRGGFIMFDKAALESLTLCNMKKLAEILQELCRTGKWKWMMHYKDSRRLKENARLSPEAKEKKHFLNWCQEVGILEVLPYHECDVMSRDQPDYLACLVRLQVQNISARYPVFITDTTTDSTFGTNGILTMTSSAILTCPPSETFTV